MKYPTYSGAETRSSTLTQMTKKPVGEVIQILTEQLEKIGFIVTSLLDVSDEIKMRLGVKFRKYEILEAWNPKLTYEAISHECHMGLKTTCSFLIQEHENGEVEVSVVNPMEHLAEPPNLGIDTIRHELDSSLNKVLSMIH